MGGLHQTFEKLRGLISILALAARRTYSIRRDQKSYDEELSKGNAELAKGSLEQAIAHYRTAAAFHGCGYDAHLRLGYALKEAGEYLQAEVSLTASLAMAPANAETIYLLGLTALANGAYATGSSRLITALQLNPDIKPAYGEAAQALFCTGRSHEAQVLISKGIDRFPHDPQMLFFQGNLCAELGDYASAASSYKKALLLAPADGPTVANLGNCERHLGNMTEALNHLRQAIAIQPHNAAWQSNLLFTLQYAGVMDPEALFQEHLRFAERFEAPFKIAWPNHATTIRNPGERLRIGYVSGDFRDHALVYFFEPVLRHHDRQKVEIFCYYTYPVHDGATERLRGLSTYWRDCSQMGDEAMMAQIMGDRIDVLVDLSGHTGHNRLTVFARKPAPVQVTWLGYQASTGLSAMDYRITDSGIDPEGLADARHSECLTRLSTAAVFQPDPESPAVNALPAIGKDMFTYGCLNNPAKITEAFLDTAARILLANHSTRLLFGNATAESSAAIRQAFTLRGVPEKRLLFVERKNSVDYLRLHYLIDLALDTFPYNGGTTTLHSLWMGVPVLCLEGDSTVSRVGVQTMRGIGLEMFACKDLEAYVEKAVMLSSQRPFMQVVRAGLRKRLEQTTVATAKTFVQDLEKFFFAARERVNQGRDNGPAP